MKYKNTLLTFAVVWLAGCSTTYVSPKAWNSVTEGMMRHNIASSIGQPASQSPGTEVWRSEGWELRVAYDQSGRATNVVRTFVVK